MSGGHFLGLFSLFVHERCMSPHAIIAWLVSARLVGLDMPVVEERTCDLQCTQRESVCVKVRLEAKKGHAQQSCPSQSGEVVGQRRMYLGMYLALRETCRADRANSERLDNDGKRLVLKEPFP
ncbi:hypothetical protein LIA77_04662 [Sarocladium implicatum]|jgi:hypothetical protein|nr:hypothetical protein LIA77_04662 [Sarocladium implicatum]